jgi:glycosyltransferase involved in cell wall biosynthesis
MLSIIIITKNEEQYLPKLLESLKNQTFKNFEIIISDANSTDKTREIAKSYGCKIIKGGKPAKGRNNGAKAAKNNLLLFLDSDIILPKDFLKDNLKEFKQRNLDCATVIYKPISNKKRDKFLHFSYNAFARGMQYLSPHAAGICILCKKQAFNKANGFNESLHIAEDHAFVSKAKKQGCKFRLLKSVPLFVSVRRAEKEGRLKLVTKYIYSGIYRLFYKEIDKEIFNYDYNHK